MIELCAAHFAAQKPKQIVIANRTIDRGASSPIDSGQQQFAWRMSVSVWPNSISSFPALPASCRSSVWGLSNGPFALAATARYSWSILPCRAMSRSMWVSWTTSFSIPSMILHRLSNPVWNRGNRRWSMPRPSLRRGLTVFFSGCKRAIRYRLSVRCAMRRNEHAATKWNTRSNCLPRRKPESVLDQLSHRLTNKFLHSPTQALNQAEGDRSELQALATRLFHLHPDFHSGE